MRRKGIRNALFAAALTASVAAGAADRNPQPDHSAIVLGPRNPLLAAGSAALSAGRFEEGVSLTLAGLSEPNSRDDLAAAHSNLCAGYAALKRWQEGLEHCNRSLELSRRNWRTFNNRAAVFVGLRQYDLALTDVNAGLALAPDSETLLKSREVVKQHRAAAARERWRRPNRA
jgi:tetratricopeptide (TPR) repeat protein